MNLGRLTVPKAFKMASNDSDASQYDPRQRAAEKAASRAKDQQDLNSGAKSVSQLRRENSAFSKLKVSVDLEYAKRIR